MVNCFRTAAGTPRPRWGTSRIKNLPAGTIGLTAFDNCLHVFASEFVSITAAAGSFTVTVADFGGDVHGFVSGALGSVDPDPALVGATTIEGAYGTPTFFFLETDGGLPSGHTEFEVEIAGGGSFETLLYADATEVSTDVFRWPNSVIRWDQADTEELIVRFGSGESEPATFCVNVLLHPTDPSASLSKIHFAAPFQGSLYVVAEFDDGGIYHYWLQEADAWEADTEYSANEFVRPTTDNYFVYRARRFGNAYPAWAPGVSRTAGNGSGIEPSRIEPTVYNEYYYEVVDTDGDNPRSGTVEPDWPTNSGERIIENADGTEAADPNEVTPPAPPEPNQPQPASLQKYLLR
jgi:hypothetical protein